MVGPLWSHHYFQNYHENLRLMKSHQKDLEILSAFIHLYCQGKHSLQKEGVPKLSPQAPAGEGLCTNCDKLLTYASMRLAACPFDPKPGVQPVRYTATESRSDLRFGKSCVIVAPEHFFRVDSIIFGTTFSAGRKKRKTHENSIAKDSRNHAKPSRHKSLQPLQHGSRSSYSSDHGTRGISRQAHHSC